MNRNPILRKSVVVGIILLFVGIVVIPSTMSESLLTDFTTSVCEIPITDIDAVSAKVPENNGSWGFIVATENTAWSEASA